MQRISFRLFIAIFTFCVGVAAATAWYINRQNQPSEHRNGRSSEQPQPQEAREPSVSAIKLEEYAVYSVVINDLLQPGDRLLIVNELTDHVPYNNEGVFNYFKNEFGLSLETINDFNNRNTQQQRLERLLDLDTRYMLISKEELNYFFSAHGGRWEAFNERYPNSQGVAAVSRVGFNPEMNQALVYRSNSYADTGGGRGYIMLTKENGIWTIKKFLGTAMS